MKIERIDHLVLTVASIAATCEFYQRVLGMEVRAFGDGRKALHFGQQKINLHEVGKEIEPKPPAAAPGAGDLCLITAEPIDAVLRHLAACGVAPLQGPVRRSGALGPITSVYFYDPDRNLIEVARYGE